MEMKTVAAILGLDLGTTSVKVSLIEEESRKVVHALSLPTAAEAVGGQSSQPPLAAEQDVKKIFRTVRNCCQKLVEICSSTNKSFKVRKIGVTGQMHGVVLWKSGLKFSDLNQTQTTADDTITGGYGGQLSRESDPEEAADIISNLFTWQDGRCSPDFLASLPKPDSHLKLAKGHGCATLFWLQRNCPEFLQQFDRAGTIMDLFVSLLCDLECPVMSVQNAASWGYFNCSASSWNTKNLSDAGFPVRLLPKINSPGSIAGQSKDHTLLGGLDTEGASVGIALGDLPCSMLPILQSCHDGAINISTSAQVVTTTPSGFTPPSSDPGCPVEYFPYFGGTYLSVAAALTGGNVLATLVRTLEQWLQALDRQAASLGDQGPLFERLIQLGMQCTTPTLAINPILGGERHQPDRRGTVENLGFNNLSLGEVFRATCRGVAKNLSEMTPPDAMRAGGVERVVGCGSALLRNPVLKQEVERAFDPLPFIYSDRGDASLGAALSMCTNFS